MLSQIIRLDHIGLFRAGVPQPIRLARVTLFYGENGRGKSTLSAVLDSYGRNRPALIQRRATIDQADAQPAATLLFHGRAPVTFENAAWSARAHELLVFDSQFIHDNVYTGIEVTPGNRKGLYEFVLGDAAADLAALERLNVESRAANQARNDHQQALTILAAPYTLEQYLALEADGGLQVQLAAARREIEALDKNEQIRARPDPARIGLPALEIAEMFSVLRRTLPNIDEEAARQVREHILRHEWRGIEQWIAQGLNYRPNEECPFCGQETANVDLLRAFGAYYSEEFRKLTDSVGQMRRVARDHLSIASITNMDAMVATNEARRQSWLDLAQTDPLEFDMAATVEEGRELQQMIERLFDAKATRLLDNIGTQAEEERARHLHESIGARVRIYNRRVEQLMAIYADRKAEIAGGDRDLLNERIRRLDAHDRRHFHPETIALVGQYQNAVTNATRAAAAKARLREQVDAQSASLVGQYQNAINARLMRLHARFQIKDFEGTHDAGRAPRASYVIELRGRQVTALNAHDNLPSFATVLSDGDRRTLALAFFLARLDVDGNLADKIIVFDDPMASFDVDRKARTVEAIFELAGRCAQTIVLSHDAFFLRDVEDHARRGGHPCVAKKIGFAGQDAALGEIDLEDMCQTSHLRRYELISKYLSGPPTGNERQVAGELRVLVEGYYKLRFPNDARAGMNLSSIRTAIANAPPTSPIAVLKPLLPDLARFDAYASRYHHDNPNAPTEVLLEQELQRYALAAMSLVHDEGSVNAVP